jgi:hypothetical protein
MSNAANWSYTAKATVWREQSREDWSSAAAFAAPITIDCTYRSKRHARTDARGDEFVTTLIFYTEANFLKYGDRIAIGEHADPLPIEAANMVRAVDQTHDVFENNADDFEVST